MLAVNPYRLGAFFAPRLPVGLSEAITDGLVDAQFTARRVTRAVTVENLRNVGAGDLSDRELHRRCHRVMRNFGRSIYQFLRMPTMTPDDLRTFVDYNGIEDVLDDLLARGAFIMVGPHVGPWEVGGAALSALGARIHTVALPHPKAAVTRFFCEQRRRVGIYSYPVSESGKALVRALTRGDQVALLVYRAYGTRARRVRLFGRNVELPTGHAALAVRFGVPILSVVCVFRPDGGVTFDYRGPYLPDASRPREAAAAWLHNKCLEDITYFIQEYPEQWFHFKRFGEPA